MNEDELPAEPIEQSQDLTRLRRAYQIACMNLTELGDQRGKLTDALNTALFLLDQLLTEMRLANVAPSSGVIITKAELDHAMRKLLGRDRNKPPED
jgi:hypothetical protein